MSALTRRTFTKQAALAGAATALSSKRVLGANERIRVGFIGLGNRGDQVLDGFLVHKDAEVVAICDLYQPYLDFAAKKIGAAPKQYHDYRKLLDQKDVDAVVVATPDHWHAIPSILACQAGKDVYCEKPLSYRIAEGRAMVEAANKYKRVTQMGNLIHASENYHRVVEIVQSGVLGTISKTRVWMAADRRGLGSPSDTSPPEGCDYDFWLGPAPKRPFNENRFLFNWRYFWDYGGGILCDFCCHIVDPVHWAMGVDYPETIVATGGRYALRDNAETPDTLEVVYHYKNGDKGFDMVWSQSDASSHGFEGRGLGIEFQGTEATLVADYKRFELFPEKGVELKVPEPTLPRSPGHHREWLNAIKSRAACSCRFDYGHRLASIGHLGNIALWTGEKLRWDGEAERVTNHAEANKHLAREVYRAPWTLPRV